MKLKLSLDFHGGSGCCTIYLSVFLVIRKTASKDNHCIICRLQKMLLHDWQCSVILRQYQKVTVLAAQSKTSV